MRLFLFPFAGGSVSLFRDWANAFPAGVDVLPVQLPGREERIGEPAFTRLEELADAASDALMPIADRPVALFGWSMGAAVAHAVARRWEIAGRPAALLIPAACPAPHLPPTRSPIHLLPGEAFWEAVARLGGLPEEVLANRELRDLTEPTLRADFAVVETRLLSAPRALSCPVAAIAAEDDRSVASRRIAAWADATTAEATLATVAGGHFAIRSNASRVTAVVRAALKSCGMLPESAPRLRMRDLM